MPTISSYTAATAVTDDDVFIGNDGSTTKKFTGPVIRTYVQAGSTAMSLNTQTGNYTLVLGDAANNVMVVMNVAGANTCTVPPEASVAFPVGSQIEVMQIGAGQTTITPGAAVSIVTASPTLKLASQYSRCVLLKTATNTWICSGEMALT